VSSRPICCRGRLAILLSACAAREALTRYPRAEIDQPYMLPQGVNT